MKVKSYFWDQITAEEDPGPYYAHQQELAEALLSFQAGRPEVAAFVEGVQQILDGWLAPGNVEHVPDPLVAQLASIKEQVDGAAALLESQDAVRSRSERGVAPMQCSPERFDDFDDLDL